jgi:hypothetical protein
MLFIFVLTVQFFPPSIDKIPDLNYRFENIESGSRIQFGSLEHALYFRRDLSKLILHEKVPWIHGSTFEVFKTNSDKECFKLRSMNNKWLRLDYFTGEILIDSFSSDKATYFSAVSYFFNKNETSKDYLLNGSPNEFNHLRLKVCKENLWFEIRRTGVLSIEGKQLKYFMNGIPDEISKTKYNYTLGLTATSMNSSLSLKQKNGWYNFIFYHTDTIDCYSSQSTMRESPTQFDYKGNDTQIGASVLSYKIVSPIRGVNLGGWFIPEVWMTPNFYVGTGLGWGGSLCRMVNYSRSLAEQRMRKMLSTWITEKDFMEIAAFGFHSVRIPIGYWNVMEDPYEMFAPSNHSISLHYIDWAFDMAEKYNLTVLLDMHGAAGSQNGIDHSGCRLFCE